MSEHIHPSIHPSTPARPRPMMSSANANANTNASSSSSDDIERHNAMGCAPSSSFASTTTASDVRGDGDVHDDDDGGGGGATTTTTTTTTVTFDGDGDGDDDHGHAMRRSSMQSRSMRGRSHVVAGGGARLRGGGGSAQAQAQADVRRVGSGRLTRASLRAGSGEGLVTATTTSGTVLRSPTRTSGGGGGGDWSVHRGQAMGRDAAAGAGRLERGGDSGGDGRKAGRLSSDARWSVGGGAVRAEEDQGTPTKAAAAFTGARANAPASPPPPIGARSYAQKRAWHKRTMSEDPNSTPSAFGRWALGSSKSRGGPRRSETTVYEDGGVEHYAGGDATGAGTHRSAHGGGIQDVIQALREQQNFVRQLTVETIRLCRPMCELEPSIDALMRLKAIDREAAARVQTCLDADARPNGAFDGKLRRANSSTSTSPNVAVAKTGLAKKGRVEFSLDDVEAELVSVQRLIQ